MLEGLKQKNNVEIEDREEWDDKLGEKDLSDTENIQVTKASIELTHREQLYIKHDYIGDTRLDPENELSTKEYQKIIKKLSEHGVNDLLITGGEPTLRDDFPKILQYAINHIDTVTVSTDGLQPFPYSDYSCNVVISLESINPVKNNQFRRMTDPDRWEYSVQQGVIADTETIGCSFCNTQFKKMRKAEEHVQDKHPKEMIKHFNQKQEAEGGTKVESIKALTDHGDYDVRDYISRTGYRIGEEKEVAMTHAMNTAERISNDTVIRSTIFNQNDLMGIGYYAQSIGADTVFVPLKPVGRAENLQNQILNPGRMKEAVEQAMVLNNVHSTNHRIAHPLFKYLEAEPDKHEEWWKQGRVSDMGINQIHITAKGNILPSPYLRKRQYLFGNIMEDDWADIYLNMAEFNTEIEQIIDGEKSTGFDVRQETVLGDPDMFLTKPLSITEQGGER